MIGLKFFANDRKPGASEAVLRKINIDLNAQKYIILGGRTFQLAGAVIHIGTGSTPNSGHYVAAGDIKGNSVVFDDDKAIGSTGFSLSDICALLREMYRGQDVNPYLLTYTKVPEPGVHVRPHLAQTLSEGEPSSSGSAPLATYPYFRDAALSPAPPGLDSPGGFLPPEPFGVCVTRTGTGSNPYVVLEANENLFSASDIFTRTMEVPPPYNPPLDGFDGVEASLSVLPPDNSEGAPASSPKSVRVPPYAPFLGQDPHPDYFTNASHNCVLQSMGNTASLGMPQPTLHLSYRPSLDNVHLGAASSPLTSSTPLTSCLNSSSDQHSRGRSDHDDSAVPVDNNKLHFFGTQKGQKRQSAAKMSVSRSNAAKKTCVSRPGHHNSAVPLDNNKLHFFGSQKGQKHQSAAKMSVSRSNATKPSTVLDPCHPACAPHAHTEESSLIPDQLHMHSSPASEAAPPAKLLRTGDERGSHVKPRRSSRLAQQRAKEPRGLADTDPSDPLQPCAVCRDAHHGDLFAPFLCDNEIVDSEGQRRTCNLAWHAHCLEALSVPVPTKGSNETWRCPECCGTWKRPELASQAQQTPPAPGPSPPRRRANTPSRAAPLLRTDGQRLLEFMGPDPRTMPLDPAFYPEHSLRKEVEWATAFRASMEASAPTSVCCVCSRGVPGKTTVVMAEEDFLPPPPQAAPGPGPEGMVVGGAEAPARWGHLLAREAPAGHVFDPAKYPRHGHTLTRIRDRDYCLSDLGVTGTDEAGYQFRVCKHCAAQLGRGCVPLQSLVAVDPGLPPPELAALGKLRAIEQQAIAPVKISGLQLFKCGRRRQAIEPDDEEAIAATDGGAAAAAAAAGGLLGDRRPRMKAMRGHLSGYPSGSMKVANLLPMPLSEFKNNFKVRGCQGVFHVSSRGVT